MKQCHFHDIKKIFALSQRPEFADVKLLQIDHVAVSAVEFERRLVLKWLHEEIDGGQRLWNKSVMLEVEQTCQWGTLLWLMEHRYEEIKDHIPYSYAWIASHNSTYMIKKMVALRPESLTTKAMDEMARYASLGLIKYLHEHTSGRFSLFAMDYAARAAHYDVVVFLHENRDEGCTSKTMDYAAKHGWLDLLKQLLAERAQGCSFVAMDKAAARGHLDVVRWLHENSTEGCSSAALDGAARYGHLEIVKFLIENRTEGEIDFAIAFAAAGRKLEVVKYLHSNLEIGRQSSRWQGIMAKHALYGNDLEVIRYVHENIRVPFNVDCLNIAKLRKDREIIEYVASRLSTAADAQKE